MTRDAVHAPQRLTNVDAGLDVRSRREGGVLIRIDSLDFRAESPALRVDTARAQVVIARDRLRVDHGLIETSAGSISVDGGIHDRQAAPTYDVRIGAHNLQLADLAPLVPALEGFALSPTLDVALHGPPGMSLPNSRHARRLAHSLVISRSISPRPSDG